MVKKQLKSDDQKEALEAIHDYQQKFNQFGYHHESDKGTSQANKLDLKSLYKLFINK